MKQNKGITLIALVITIIVLLILAGITIAMLSGDNGILNRSNEAKYDNIVSTFDEQVRLAQLGLKTTITAKMTNTAGYIATTGANFKDLVTEVRTQLGAGDVNDKATDNQGYSVYQYLNYGSDEINGTGYILITYSDNALRSSLPASLSLSHDDVWNVAGGIKYNAAIKTTATADSFSRNKAVLAYVIKVTNYSCVLSEGIITTTTTESESGSLGTADPALATAASATTFETKTIYSKTGF